MPAVSVVVPCYNGGRFLDQIVETLSAQSFDDFEVIVVDDGSTEELTIARLAALPPEFRVIRQKNRGLPGARNTGFREARAPFVLPLDCDDTIAPSFLAETLAVLRQAPPEVGFVFTHEELVGARSGIVANYFNPFDQLFMNRVPACMLLRRSAWQKAGGYDESMREGYEDWEFSLRLIRAGYEGVEIPRVLATYYVSGDGMLINQSSRLHATLWRRIRERNRGAYRLPAILRCWRENRQRQSRIALPVALAMLAAATVIPEGWFSAAMARLRRARLAGEPPRNAAAA